MDAFWNCMYYKTKELSWTLFWRILYVLFVPWDEQRLPSLERLHMRCKPTVSIRHLCQYVASNIAAKADEIEILLVQQKELLCILEGHETSAELQAMYSVTQRDMRFAYRQKLPASMNYVRS
ncbi:hypothetical protein POM88_013703 [Heracleum sosnowskyi]|uniref:Uncharacterized protein n=1 Tax=Heracleum sosnowskyi TaxID=360622 RepID=A0AAD8J2D1_9APIA|nr:hypothetical protein POM88_013703 [Heracleum sosnowskyi]